MNHSRIVVWLEDRETGPLAERSRRAWTGTGTFRKENFQPNVGAECCLTAVYHCRSYLLFQSVERELGREEDLPSTPRVAVPQLPSLSYHILPGHSWPRYETGASTPRVAVRQYTEGGSAPVEGLTHQVDSLVGLDLKLTKIPPEDSLKLRRLGTILKGFSGALLGPILIALGPAL